MEAPRLPPIVIRPASREDLAVFYGPRAQHTPTLNAWVGEAGGRLVGCGGVARINGRRLAFCDLTPAGEHYRLALVRAARMVLAREAERAGESGTTVFAMADPARPTASRFLTWLGFKPDPTMKGRFRWQA